ncbi:hypothetical protein HPB47_004278 [Ixodes persulcatus]|uniref:Uncharacterized protein n=1 Tax=Ixodes persulcatus TaxID=34615 RepID=A0AC60PG57_IXOPE|nr:hypothetical protein HPB47_004278 [Ixodes persulcatus]
MFRKVKLGTDDPSEPYDEDVEDVLNRPEEYYDRHQDIILRKYFKVPPETNLLTWAAKQQIHHLHTLDPEEWSPERIAECFPISAQGARKLLKTQFLEATPERIREHDLGVSLKWKALKEGRFDDGISPVTRQLYLEGKLNATSRQLRVQSRYNRKPGEFSRLISGYLHLKNKEEASDADVPKREMPYEDRHLKDLESATTLKSLKRHGSHVRFQEYKDAALERIGSDPEIEGEWSKWLQERGVNPQASEDVVDVPHAEAFVESSAPVSEIQPGSVDEMFEIYRDRTLDRTLPENARKDLEYPLTGEAPFERQIKIPPRLKKKNAASMYRVGKCYYDEDGEILFKVP